MAMVPNFSSMNGAVAVGQPQLPAPQSAVPSGDVMEPSVKRPRMEGNGQEVINLNQQFLKILY